MTAIILAIDIGSSHVKCIAIDSLSVVHKSVTQPVAPSTNATRGEIRVDRLWESTRSALRSVVESIRASDLVGIVVTGAGDGLVLVDQHGAVVRDPIVSSDLRAAGVIDTWRNEGVLDELSRRIGEVPFPGTPLALLRWVSEFEPEVYRTARYVGLLKDWLRVRLTGAFLTDPTDGSATLTDVLGNPDPDIFRIAGIPHGESLMPDIRDPWAVAGYVTTEAGRACNLPIGTPVFTGVHDCTASSLGVGGEASGTVTMIAGTWSGNQTVLDRPITDLPRMNRWILRRYALPETWLAICASPTSMAVVDWFRDSLSPLGRSYTGAGATISYDEMERYLHEVATEEVPVFHPYLYGSREDARASAGFRGIRAHHDVRHLLRAVYEGVAFNHADHLANLTVAVPPQRLTLVGGGTRSREFTRILAGTLNRPIEVFASDLVTAKGAAVVGMVGAGVYRSLIESMRALVTQGETVYPEAVYVRNAVARRKTYDEVRDSLAQRRV